MREELIMEQNKIVVFESKNIRRIWHNEEWYFSVVDVVGVLTDSVNPRDYWFKMKLREKSEAGIELSIICLQLKLESTDGKKYATDCANTAGMFRIMQSIPSPKAEPFKQWLAKVGSERVQGLTKKNQNLRDHMTDLELIFTMLGEKVTTEISQNEKPKTFVKSKLVAKRGGRVAGKARKETEKELGRSIVTNQNYFPKSKKSDKEK